MWPAAGREADAEGCLHEWGALNRPVHGTQVGHTGLHKPGPAVDAAKAGQNAPTGAFCSLCGSWRGGLGLEPDPFLYTEHLVAVFREVRRVLHATGVCWVNLGSSYAGGGRAGSNPEYHAKHTMFGQAGHDPGKFGLPQPVPSGYKATDLVDIPHLVAEALRTDGWYLRAAMPWIKPANPMPESVRSRPVSSVEYWFMLTKGPGGSAYYDAEAVRTPYAASSIRRISQASFWQQDGGPKAGVANPNMDARKSVENLATRLRPHTDRIGGAGWEGRGQHGEGSPRSYEAGGRAFRVSDLFLASLDEEIADAKPRLAHLEACRGKDGGLLLDEDGDPLALLVNPRGFSGAKYLGDWSRKEWRPVDPQDPSKGKRKVEVWYIAAPDCASHAHYHRADKWARLGYADGREAERRAGDVDGAKCGCVEVTVDHFSAFSEQLVTPLVRACCPPEVCEKCGAPKVREVKASERYAALMADRQGHDDYHTRGLEAGLRFASKTAGLCAERETLAWSPSCECGAGFVPGTVCDPFSGTGTVGSVCRLEGRRYIGIDCSVDYLVMQESRIRETGLTGEKGKQHAAAARGGQRTLFAAAAGE